MNLTYVTENIRFPVQDDSATIDFVTIMCRERDQHVSVQNRIGTIPGYSCNVSIASEVLYHLHVAVAREGVVEPTNYGLFRARLEELGSQYEGTTIKRWDGVRYRTFLWRDVYEELPRFSSLSPAEQAARQ